MKNELEEVMEQINEMLDPMLLMARRMYQKMGENTDMWKELAKCYKTAVDAFVEAGFSREEAISMAIASLNNFGKK
jgi:gas vesicle protein